jgi:hypothetical protein
VGQTVAAFAGSGLGVQVGMLVGVVSGVGHDDLRIWHDVGDLIRRGRNCIGSGKLSRFLATGSYRFCRVGGVHSGLAA